MHLSPARVSADLRAAETMSSCSFAAALPGWQGVFQFELGANTTVAEVLVMARERVRMRCATAAEHVVWEQGATGIFGVACARTQIVHPHDRVELYLPLSVDPKEARRARAQRAR